MKTLSGLVNSDKNKMKQINIRPIQREDNAAMAIIIRNALKEFGADKPGTVYYDETTDHLFELFQKEKSAYAVAVEGNQILGGAGIYPTNGLPHDTCELVKIYLSPAARGKGIGGQLMEFCFDSALKKGFTKMYIETMPELATAVKMYEKFGFTYLTQPMGNSGHTGCDIWMLKEL
jgi:putative acetyltransferase